MASHVAQHTLFPGVYPSDLLFPARRPNGATLRPFTALGLAMLDQLPPRLQTSSDYQGVIHPLSREFARLEACIEQVRAQFNPASADLLLNAWEYSVKLPVGGQGASLEQRQQKVISRLKKLLGQSEGREWEAQVTDMFGPGWSYEEHIPGDVTSPPSGTLRITLPFAPSTGSYADALVQIREITPAHLAIEFSSAGGFQLDASTLDNSTFGY